MDVKLYTGNGSTQTISGLGFSPDLVWLKARSFAPSHHLFDTIRGATKFLGSDTTNAEQTGADRLTAFDSTGFTLGSNAEVNQSSSTYVAWAWDAGTSTDPSNTAGSITSQVRANVSAGFSVVTYTGQWKQWNNCRSRARCCSTADYLSRVDQPDSRLACLYASVGNTNTLP
jgi:hypothetical protein